MQKPMNLIRKWMVTMTQNHYGQQRIVNTIIMKYPMIKHL